MGLIAQEVMEVVPEVVTQGSEYLSVKYSRLVALLIEAVKEQQTRIEKLEQQLP